MYVWLKWVYLLNFVNQCLAERCILSFRLRLNWLQTDYGNDFPKNGGVWLLLQIRSNWKAFSVNRIWEPKQRKWFSVSIFTSNYFRPWKIEERGRKKESIATSPSADIIGWCGSADRNHSFARSREASTAPIAISPSFVRIWWFFSGFCLCFEEWMILCIRLVIEKMWENVSNKYKMCFLRYFQEHNQTSENIFRNIFWNATKHMKIFSFPENIYFLEILLHEPNAA